jgi:hypothetical protein
MVGRLSTACILPLTLCAPWGAQAWSSTSPACPGVVTPQIVVTVIDQADGLYLCDAVVTASDSSSTYAATPPHNQTVSDAGYFVCPGKSGTYAAARASMPGLMMTQPAPTVTLGPFDQCGYARRSDHEPVLRPAAVGQYLGRGRRVAVSHRGAPAGERGADRLCAGAHHGLRTRDPGVGRNLQRPLVPVLRVGL